MFITVDLYINRIKLFYLSFSLLSICMQVKKASFQGYICFIIKFAYWLSCWFVIWTISIKENTSIDIKKSKLLHFKLQLAALFQFGSTCCNNWMYFT